MKIRFWQVAVLLGVLLLSVISFSSAATPNYFDLFNQSEISEGYYTMINRKDNSVILRTARILHPGDQYIDQDNRHFRVLMVDEKKAWAEQIESKSSFTQGAPALLPSGGEIAARNNQNEKLKVGIYHTHGAESYVPSDGTETIEQGGGILQVGDNLARALREKGFVVNHIREPHTPHDAGAYQRSRRTAQELVTEGDQLIFDVHRDAVPPEEYEKTVEGEDVTRILLVVGQQNQNAENNRQFAATLKQIADEQHPGLVKGILGAQGNYNQDLTPRAILLEVGAHENNREDAERAVALFADVIDRYTARTEAAPGQPPAARTNRLALSSVLKVIVLLAAALFIYLLVAAGSWEEMKRKVGAFFAREFADLRVSGRQEDDGEGDQD